MSTAYRATTRARGTTAAAVTASAGAHPWAGLVVRDIASGGGSGLTDVVREWIPSHRGRQQTVLLPYIQPDTGIAWSTAPANVTVVD